MPTAIAAALWLVFADGFEPTCTLPFQSIAMRRPIDKKCGKAGNAHGALGSQDTAKNDFCATGDPVTLQFADYTALQAAAEKALGTPDYDPPTDRKPLQSLYTIGGKTIGEGSVVRVVGFVDRARYSDVEKGESVNCNIPGDAYNDVHIPLTARAGEDECTSVTAEMSPHFRPDAWTPANLNRLNRPVRVTGQLFFDASHKPCTKDKPEEPKRRSVWEIHPVYAVEVCRSRSACAADRDEQWQPLDQYLARRN
jgi:hypothetical protein